MQFSSVKKQIAALPDTATGITKLVGNENSIPRFGDKKAVADMTGMSRRWVDAEISKGMPMLALGSRRCRFDLQEVAAWLRDRYHVQRSGPAKASP